MKLIVFSIGCVVFLYLFKDILFYLVEIVGLWGLLSMY